MDDTTNRLLTLDAKPGVVACAAGVVEGDRVFDVKAVHSANAFVLVPPTSAPLHEATRRWHAALTKALEAYLAFGVISDGDQPLYMKHGRYTIQVMRPSSKQPPVAVAIESGHPFMKSLARTVRRVFWAGGPR